MGLHHQTEARPAPWLTIKTAQMVMDRLRPPLFGMGEAMTCPNCARLRAGQARNGGVRYCARHRAMATGVESLRRHWLRWNGRSGH